MACLAFQVNPFALISSGTAERATLLLHEATHMCYDGWEHVEDDSPQRDEWYPYGVSNMEELGSEHRFY